MSAPAADGAAFGRPRRPERSPALPAPVPERVPWPAIALFAVVAFGGAWLVALPMWLGGGLAHPLAPVLIPAMMFTPALAVVVTMLVLRTPPRGERLRALGIWPLRPYRRTLWLTAAAMILPVAVIAAAAFLAGVLGFVELDPAMSGFASATRQQALLAGADPSLLPPPQVLFAAQLAALPLGVLVNALLAFGEEVGWRGWLLPALRPLGVWPSLLLSGAVWGLWHAPVILLGYNFGRTDATGVLLMIAGCTAWGALFGWLRLRTGSVWPAVIGHAALNAAAGFLAFFLPVGVVPDLALAGPLGVAAWIVLAAVVAVLAACGQLGRRLPR